MTERRKTAVLLVVLGGALAVLGSTQDLVTVAQQNSHDTFTIITTLWGDRSSPSMYPDVNTVVSVGLPLLVFAALMVAAAAGTLRSGRIAAVARTVVLGAAGLFAGTVVAFVFSVLHQEAMVAAYPVTSDWTYVLTFDSGLYVLMVAALAALTGAVLAQRPQPEAPEPEAGEEAVVVHQFMDDDTPPFGLAMPVEEQQEAR